MPTTVPAPTPMRPPVKRPAAEQGTKRRRESSLTPTRAARAPSESPVDMAAFTPLRAARKSCAGRRPTVGRAEPSTRATDIRVMEVENNRLRNEAHELQARLESEVSARHTKEMHLREKEKEVLAYKHKLVGFERREQREKRKQSRTRQERKVTECPEIDRLRGTIHRLRGDLADESKKEAVMGEINVVLEAVVSAREREIELLQADNDELADRLKDKEDTELSLQRAQGELAQEKARFGDTEAGLSKDLAALQERLAAREDEMAREFAAAAAKRQDEFSSLRSVAAKQAAAAKALQASLDTARQELESMKTSNDSLQKRSREIQAESDARVQELTKHVAEARTQRDAAEQKVAAVQEQCRVQVTQACMSVQELKGQRDAKADSLLNQQKEDARRIRELMDSLQKERGEKAALEADAQSVKKELRAAKAVGADLEDRLGAAQRRAAAAHGESDTLRKELTEIRPALDAAMQEAHALKRSRAEHEKAAARAEEKLRDDCEKRKKEVARIAAELQAAQSAAENWKADAASAKQAAERAKTAAGTRQQQAEAREQKLQQQLSSHAEQAAKLRTELAAESAKRADADSCNKKLADQLRACAGAAEQKVASLERKCARLEEESQSFRNDLSKAASENQARGKARDQQLERYRADALDAKTKVSDLAAELQTRTDEVAELQLRVTAQEKEAEEQAETIDRLRQENRHVAELKESLVSTSQTLERHKTWAEQLRKQVEEMEGKEQVLDEEVEQLTYKLKVAEHECKTAEDRQRSVQTRLDTRTADVAKLKKAYSKLGRDANDTIDELNKEVGRLEAVSNDYKAKYDDLKQKYKAAVADGLPPAKRQAVASAEDADRPEPAAVAAEPAAVAAEPSAATIEDDDDECQC
eukprot:TRINITY_DN923_c6_g1_i1.p1 TRINITY_DN923_c6_g1~~TRINITY_DN923_c6_g1_i1.p1  ORF type:complete len:880 (+),score=438.80 TRINITY_DN923_c6_g1_i1:136-2775(+)